MNTYKVIKSTTKLLIVSSSLLSSIYFFSAKSQAQVSLSPLVIEQQADRGQAQDFIEITNRGDEPFRARVYAEAYTYDMEKGFQTLSSTPTDLRPYLQFSPRELVIPPRTKRRIRLIARLAPNLPNGEYRAMIFTQPLRENNISNNTNNSSANIITRIGSAFIVRKGEISPKLNVKEARWSDREKRLNLLLQNDGKASAYTSINWQLKHDNKTIQDGQVSPHLVTAGSGRNINLSSFIKNPLNLQPGNYQLTGELIWGDRRQNRQPFSINFTLPAQTGVKK